jgi:hypothetical protein
MVQRGDGTRFTFEAVGEAVPGDLDRDQPVQARITCLVDLAHAPGTDDAENLIGPQAGSGAQWHVIERL